METAQFDANFADAVVRSFRDDAIRTAVLIDDQFPTYLQMRGAAVENEFEEVGRAANLYGFFHQRGLICDIENWRKPDEADLDLIDKVRKSDLVVLDYQLGVGGPKTALEILRHLAVSAHFNLVVLYTNDSLSKVALSAAAAMRGVATPDPKLVPSAEVLGEAEAILDREEFREVDADGLVAYLTRGETPWKDDLQAAMTEADMHLRSLRPLTDHVARSWIKQVSGGYVPVDGPLIELRCNLADASTIWIHGGSCFVAVVDKQKAGDDQAEGIYVWNRIGAALRAWRPNFYRLMLSDIQNTLELEAVTDHEAWLDDNLCLGLGLYLLESDDAAAGKMEGGAVAGSAQSLIDRFVDLIRRRLATHVKITETATSVISARLSTALGPPRPGETGRHVRARELAHVAADAACEWQEKVLPAVNAFMISDEFRGGHITTGSVLRSGETDYWLCVSPACDLEPRATGPVLLQLIRLTKGPSTDKYSTGEHIVITTQKGPAVLTALNALNRQPSLKVVLLPNGTGVVREGAAAPVLTGWFASGMAPSAFDPVIGAPPPAAAEPVIEATAETVAEPDLAAVVEATPGAPVEARQPAPAAHTGGGIAFTVVAQLRGTFATRFLMSAGQHLSRVGVDFIDL
ncbi:response regulator receiver domain [Mesorhizobium sp. ES1-6]|uniref:response regulator receiver domain n=1 Tax=Mesorhizobium sp. ES1-6 TaxID=2876626 RepID=UPI001CC94ADE|nr:response regulator receiver domain [Mesorhizobium sp. ES1-6]MBZ9801178.1 hypothetical protein [Mesorhizobium sp. ES1-6]